MSKLFTIVLLTLSAGTVAPQAAWSGERSGAPLTRAEVRAEVAQARADGTLPAAGELMPVEDDFVSQRTRGDVRSEVARARADHTLPAIGERGALAPAVSAGPARDREAVREEGRRAAHDFSINELYVD